MEQTLASAMGELESCRMRLERLRAEKRCGVPLGEVERWCASITTQLSAVGNSVAAKLEACNSMVRRRDTAIRRLHRQVQELSELGTRVSDSGQVSEPCSAAQAVVGPVGWPFSRNANTGTSTPATTDGAEDGRPVGRRLASDISDAESTPSILSTVRSGGLPSASPSSRSGQHLDEEKTPGGIPRTRRVTGSPSVESAAREIQKLNARRGTTDAYALERAQHAQLRREVAHLRRGHVELVGQLRARDAQVEQLTAMIRELLAQRQIGLYKRQLNLQDNSLYALQEEILLDRNAPAGPRNAGPRNAPASEMLLDRNAPVGGAAQSAPNGERSFRGARPLGGTSASGPSLMVNTDRRTSRSGLGPGTRASDGGHSVASGSFPVSVAGETRGRVSGAAGAGPATSVRRERSMSAAPYTPRGKLRDLVGHPTRVAVETPGARSSGRTTSAARAGAAVVRSTSVEAQDRTARRLRDGVAAARRR